MNLKPIDLQIALNRTGEAGNVQNQLNQKPLHDHSQAMNSAVKQHDESRKTAAKTDETDEAAIRDDGETHSGRQEQQRKSKEKQEQRTNEAAHPYKGRHIDFTL